MLKLSTTSQKSAYQNLDQHLSKIDKRNTKYQFDLEKDIAWSDINQPGDYFADEYLEKSLGIDIKSLKAHPEAWELMQWCEAVTLCSLFTTFEEEVIDFTDVERDQIGTSRSLELLCSEEDKHIELFQRLEHHLRSMKPKQSEQLNELYKNTMFSLGLDGKEYKVLRQIFGPAGVHAYKWLGVMFFEEATIHIYDAINVEGADIQPTWLSAHKAHRTEELQHVVTDSRYLDAIDLSPADKRTATAMFVCNFLEEFMVYRRLVANLVEASYPEVSVLHKDEDLAITCIQHLISQKAFKRSRHYAPFLQEMLTMQPDEVWPNLCEVLGEALIGDRDPLTPPWRKNKCSQFITSAA